MTRGQGAWTTLMCLWAGCELGMVWGIAGWVKDPPTPRRQNRVLVGSVLLSLLGVALSVARGWVY